MQNGVKCLKTSFSNSFIKTTFRLALQQKLARSCVCACSVTLRNSRFSTSMRLFGLDVLENFDSCFLIQNRFQSRYDTIIDSKHFARDLTQRNEGASRTCIYKKLQQALIRPASLDNCIFKTTFRQAFRDLREKSVGHQRDLRTDEDFSATQTAPRNTAACRRWRPSERSGPGKTRQRCSKCTWNPSYKTDKGIKPKAWNELTIKLNRELGHTTSKGNCEHAYHIVLLTNTSQSCLITAQYKSKVGRIMQVW